MSEEDLKESTEVEDNDVEIEVAQPEPDESVSSVEVSTSSEDDSSGGEELENYSKNVQKRIKKLTEKYRQEERDRTEAVRIAQQLKSENDQLKSRVQSLDSGYLTEYGTRLESQLAQVKQKYGDAQDRGDVDKLFEAQQELNRIQIEQERHRIATQRQQSQGDRVQVQAQEQPQQQAPVAQQAPVKDPDPKAQSWATKNEWFGQDEVMTYAAFGIHRKLVEEEGFDPTSDEYYNEVNSRMRREFPHKFKGQKSGGSSQVAAADTSASRNSGRSRKVKLSPSQVQMAKRLGVPLEEYAKYVKP